MAICLNREFCRLAAQNCILLLSLSISPYVWPGDKPAKESADNNETAATPSPTPPKRQALPTNLDSELHQLLSKELEKEDLVTLTAMGEEFICIWKHTSIGKALGAILIVHEEGQNADWPLTIKSLREELAEFGWSTLAVSLPNPHSPPILLRPTPTEAPQPTPDSASDEKKEEKKDAEPKEEDAKAPTTDPQPELAKSNEPAAPKSAPVDIEAVVQARLQAAIEHLHSIGQFNLAIIGNGLGAARASVFINQLMSASAEQEMSKNAATANAKAIIKRPIRALVLINGRNNIPNTEDNLPSQLKDKGLPVLDIVFNDHYLDKYEAKARQRKASRLQMDNYFQVKMRRPISAASEGNNRLVKRVRGFLNRHAKGVEIPK